jgi:hypothetical protein
MKERVITQKLSRYELENISELYDFNQRSDAKITLLNFIGGFFQSLTFGHSLREWAARIGGFLPFGKTVSKTGLQKRFGINQLNCVKAFLQKVMVSDLKNLESKSLAQGWFSGFGKVLLEDSVCVSLNERLFSLFPGSHSNKGKAATARIQVCLNLKGMAYERFDLQSYRDNDQKYSSEILSLLQPGDLVIRDLGYSVLKVFKYISNLGAFFLGRYKSGMNLYDPSSGEVIDLGKYLSRVSARSGIYVDINVIAGAKERVPMRLVAYKCPPEVAQERIRKARNNRNQKANHSKEYYQLLQWSIFLTNVPAETLKAKEVIQVYGFRWHIEMVFKVWKSKFGLQRIMTYNSIEKIIHAQIFFYLFLAYLCIFYMASFRFYFLKIHQIHRKFLSPFKFADFLKNYFIELIEAQIKGQQQEFVDQLASYCCYEKRKNRINQLEAIFKITDAAPFSKETQYLKR